MLQSVDVAGAKQASVKSLSRAGREFTRAGRHMPWEIAKKNINAY
jgi:hypothetical protein